MRNQKKNGERGALRLLPTVANSEDGNGSKQCYRRTVTGQFLPLRTHMWVAGPCERARVPVPDHAPTLKRIPTGDGTKPAGSGWTAPNGSNGPESVSEIGRAALAPNTAYK